MSAPAAPPAWVMALPLDPGAWRVLVGLWSYADYDATGEQVVGPTREKLAARIGIKTSGLRKQLSKLRADGWIRDARGGRFGFLGLGLAWVKPFQVDRSAVQVAHGPGGPVDGPGGASKRSTCRAKAVQVDTHTLQDLAGPCIDLAEEGSADDATPEPLSLDERIAATSPAAAIATSMGHPSNPKSWAGIMAEARTLGTLTDDDVIALLVAWESAPRETRPPMTEFWWSRHRAWRDEQLGIKPVERRRPGAQWDLTSGAVYTPPSANGGAS